MLNQTEATDILHQLLAMYESTLGKGPFPTRDCTMAKLTGTEHGTVVLFLSNIAGIASHGEKLATIAPARRAEFEKIVAQSFAEQWPKTSAKITPERSPQLFHLMECSEEARLLIARYLASDADRG